MCKLQGDWQADGEEHAEASIAWLFVAMWWVVLLWACFRMVRLGVTCVAMVGPALGGTCIRTFHGFRKIMGYGGFANL